MKFLTKKLMNELPKLGATSDKDPKDVKVVVKFFTPDAAASWYITEADLDEGLMFGWCDLGLGFPELGYVSVDELKQVRGKFGLPVERDLYFSGTLDQVMKGEVQ